MEYKNRKPLRLPEFDYSTQGAYFITICTHNRQKTLSQIVGAIHESPIPPSHAVGAIHESPLRKRSPISNAVGYIKMNVSKIIHKHFADEPVWQRGYYDHVIRNERDYLEIAKYIDENPLRWQLDCYYEL